MLAPSSRRPRRPAPRIRTLRPMSGSGPSQADAVDELRRQVATALTSAQDPNVAAAAVEVGELRRLSGGASRETWAFSADGRALILQRTRPGSSMGGPSMADEDRLLAAAVVAGVPVPEVVVDAAGCEPYLGPARITAHVLGEALGPRIVRDDRFAPARSVLVGQCGRALAAIHSIDPVAVTGLESVDVLERLRTGLDLVEEARPAFELALRWLADHRPPARPPAVVHGDFRVGNLLVDPASGLTAVLDWELAHLGDPLEDLGWLCTRAWRFGGAGEVGGIGPVSDLLDTYAEATGAPVDPDHVRWWIVAGTLTWGLICAVQARRHLDGHVQSVELATIGRRVVETEYDLLGLLGLDAPPDGSGPAPSPTDPNRGRPAAGSNAAPPLDRGPDRAAAADPTVEEAGPDRTRSPDRQGRPTAAELLDAVRSHLADQVAPTLDGSAAFQLKVAGNALAIVERELRLGPAMALRATELLAGLGLAGVTDEASLAAAIRGGEVDGPPGSPLAATVRALAVDRLRIANPKWLLPPDRSPE